MMLRRQFISIAGVILLTAAVGRAQSTQLVSIGTGGAAANGDSILPSVTPDGRLVVFSSDATNLVASDTNATRDVFLRDRITGINVRISVATGGAQSNGSSYASHRAITPDGRYVVITSAATNLVAGDANAKFDVFVRDRQAGTTERVSLSSLEAEGNGDSYAAAISGDGRYVAFTSSASNLDPTDGNGVLDVFVRDRTAGTTERCSVDSAEVAGNGESDYPRLSADGRFVAFRSDSTNLVAGDTNARSDIFVRDRTAGTTERDSFDDLGNQFTTHCSPFLDISADGNYVAFTTPEFSFGESIYIRDRSLAATAIVAGGGSGYSTAPQLSGTGLFFAFISDQVHFPPDTNGVADVFVWDPIAAIGARESVSTAGAQGTGPSGIYGLGLTPDQRFLAFDSGASNLVAGDTNGVIDIFIRDRDETGFMGFCYPEINGVRSCPCANPATAPDLGCDNFIGTSTVSGTGGAKLAATGVPHASLSSTLVFHVTQAHNPGGNSNLHTFWKGTSNLVVGVKSGFGVRCVAGTLKRIYQGNGTGSGGLGSTNAVDFPNGTQTTDAWTASQMPAAGTTLYYYDSFRDQQGPATCNTASDKFNVSHAGAVTWVP